MMKSFLFCTCYINDRDSYQRYVRWIKYYVKRMGSLGVSKVLLIDDGSDTVWLNRLTKELGVGTVSLMGADAYVGLEYETNTPVNIVAFKENFGRPTAAIVAGWWRSFSFASEIALRKGYDKIIHIESDAYILNPDMLTDMAKIESGWQTAWAYKLNYMESAIQVIAGPLSLGDLHTFWKFGKPFWFRQSREEEGYAPELLLPKHITGTFKDKYIGDRYGDDRHALEEIPESPDYICNTHDISLGKRMQKHIEEKVGIFARLIAMADGEYVPSPSEPAPEEHVYLEFDVRSIKKDIVTFLRQGMGKSLPYLFQRGMGTHQPDGTFVMYPHAVDALKGMGREHGTDMSEAMLQTIAAELIFQWVNKRIEGGGDASSQESDR